jgi:hypothetical protein
MMIDHLLIAVVFVGAIVAFLGSSAWFMGRDD